LLTSHGDGRTFEHRLSQLQRVILEELASIRESKTASPEALSIKVAERYSPEKVWRLENCDPLLRGLARSIHKKRELVNNNFSASFSRSLRNLEKKGLIQLIKGKFELDWKAEHVSVYRIHTPQPRVTLVVHHDSRYFGNSVADAQFIADIVKELRAR
jgi:hypothetical protein